MSFVNDFESRRRMSESPIFPLPAVLITFILLSSSKPNIKCWHFRIWNLMRLISINHYISNMIMWQGGQISFHHLDLPSILSVSYVFSFPFSHHPPCIYYYICNIWKISRKCNIVAKIILLLLVFSMCRSLGWGGLVLGPDYDNEVYHRKEH